MSDLRWRKVTRDIWIGRGRMALMAVAVAVSLFALGTALNSFAILSRELTGSYLRTRPASATIEMDTVGSALVNEVRTQPGIKEAEARATVRARVRVGSDWRPLLLFVVPDFANMRPSSFTRLTGDWPPPPGTMLVDHMALSILEAKVGQKVVVKSPRGRPTRVRLSGVVWDSSLAPAGMERTAWGYITPDTLAYLGEGGGLDELKILVADQPLNTAAIFETARRLVDWLQLQGHIVREIQIPPPGQHPHQGQMNAVMLMLNIFALLALLLSGVLVGSTVASMMVRQVREIGVMKAVGASRGQIARLYLGMMLALGLGALFLSVPPSVLAAKALVRMVAYNLNIQIESLAIPWWVFAAQCTAGLLIPLAAAAIPIIRSSRMTVQQAIHESGGAVESFGVRRFDVWLSRCHGLNPLVLLGVRNAFRHRGRLILTLALLASGGAMYMTGLNTEKAWSIRLEEVRASRKYDVAIRFQHPAPIDKATAVVRGVSGVSGAEAWGLASASWGDSTEVPVVHTYPDKAHGSFQVVGTPVHTKLIDFPVLAGRWLEPRDDQVVVLNHMAAGARPQVTVGSTGTISFDGLSRAFRVVGFVRDLGSPATAYIPLRTFVRLARTPGTTQLLGVTTEAQDHVHRGEVIGRVEHALEDAGMGIDVSLPVEVLRTAVGEHMALLLSLILGLAALMSIVGLLGLTAAMSISVIERTREIGVMQAVGAAPVLVLRVVLAEGVFTGVLSGLLAVLLALPLSALVGIIVGELSFRAPLPLVTSPLGVLSWIAIVITFSAAATAVPAMHASRMSVREALAYN